MANVYRQFAQLVMRNSYTEDELTGLLKAFMTGSANVNERARRELDDVAELLKPLVTANTATLEKSLPLIQEDLDRIAMSVSRLYNLLPPREET